jgi:DNA-binding IclR family transcriptional regulator
LFDSHGRIAGSISIVLQSPRASDVVMSRLKAALVEAARGIERMRDGGALPGPGGRRKIRSGAKA